MAKTREKKINKIKNNYLIPLNRLTHITCLAIKIIWLKEKIRATAAVEAKTHRKKKDAKKTTSISLRLRHTFHIHFNKIIILRLSPVGFFFAYKTISKQRHNFVLMFIKESFSYHHRGTTHISFTDELINYAYASSVLMLLRCWRCCCHCGCCCHVSEMIMMGPALDVNT